MEEQNDPAAVTPTPPATEEIPVEAVLGAEADLGKRIAGALIDTLIAFALAWVAGMVWARLAYPLVIAYMLLRDSFPFLDGQSIGKKVVGLRAITETGVSLSGNWKEGAIRNILMVVPLGSLVELIIMVVNKDKPGGLRRLGDQWAKTKVITVAK